MKFARAKFAPAQQGLFDGFCGIYAGLNFFDRRLPPDPERKRAKDMFRRILADLQSQRKLTADRICDGFLEGQLQKAFNREAEFQNLALEILRFDVFRKRTGAATIFDTVALLKEDEAAILSTDREDHWVLAFACDGQTMRIDDSFAQPRTLTWHRRDTISHGLSKKHGLVFLNA